MKNKLLFLFLLLLVFAHPVHAVDLNIICLQEGPCTMSPASGKELFYETNILPGHSVTQTFTVQNLDSRYNCPLQLKTRNQTQTPSDFADKLLTQITDGTNIIYGSPTKTLNDLYSDTSSWLFLGNVPASSSVSFDWTVTFDPLTGNEYKHAKTVFDFDLNFACGAPETTPTPTPDNGDGDDDGDGDGGTGGDGGETTTTTTALPFVGGLVQGVQTFFTQPSPEPSPSPSPEPSPKAEEQIKGETTCCPKICPWWWIVLILEITFLTNYYQKRLAHKKQTDIFIISFTVFIIGFFAHMILSSYFVKNLGYQKSQFSQFFTLISIISIILIDFSYAFLRKDKNEKK